MWLLPQAVLHRQSLAVQPVVAERLQPLVLAVWALLVLVLVIPSPLTRLPRSAVLHRKPLQAVQPVVAVAVGQLLPLVLVAVPLPLLAVQPVVVVALGQLLPLVPAVVLLPPLAAQPVVVAVGQSLPLLPVVVPLPLLAAQPVAAVGQLLPLVVPLPLLAVQPEVVAGQLLPLLPAVMVPLLVLVLVLPSPRLVSPLVPVVAELLCLSSSPQASLPLKPQAVLSLAPVAVALLPRVPTTPLVPAQVLQREQSPQAVLPLALAAAALPQLP